MELSALDPGKIFALMGAGGLFALAGLYLMFRPKADGHSAKIEIFGMKFESSSAGLLVFVIGSAFLASPLFIRESTDPDDGLASTSTASDPNDAALVSSEAQPAGVTTTTPQPLSVQTSPARAITAVGEEAEPNNTIAVANEIPVGSLITGEVAEGDMDFYSFTFPGDFDGQFTVNLSSGARDIGFTIFDELGGEYKLRSDWRRYSRDVDQERYYLGVWTRERRAAYSLTVAARSE